MFFAICNNKEFNFEKIKFCFILIHLLNSAAKSQLRALYLKYVVHSRWSILDSFSHTWILLKLCKGKKLLETFLLIFIKGFIYRNIFSFKKLYKSTSKDCSYFCGCWVASLFHKFSYHAYNKVLIKLLLL